MRPINVAITNNTGLRNRGCEALVVSLMEGLQRNFEQPLDVMLQTNDPAFDKWRLQGVGNAMPSYLTLTPNHFSSIGFNKFVYACLSGMERLAPSQLGGYRVNQIKTLREADLVLPTGGDILTSDYGNLRKHLSSILAFKGKKAALVAHTIGPFKKDDEAYFKKSLDNVFLITVRESESYEYLKSLNLDIPLHLTADVAFGLKPTSKEESKQFLKGRFGVDSDTSQLVALSVSEGVIRYSKLSRAQYFSELTEFVRRLNAAGKVVLLIPHVMERNPNNNDLLACEELHAKLPDQSMCRIVAGEFTASQFKGIIGLTECLIGARTHATIGSMSQAVPTVSIAYSRKAYGIMTDVFGPKLGPELTLPATSLAADALEAAYHRAMAEQSFAEVAVRMKALAETNYTLLKQHLPRIS
ncbi:MAG: polysaccharide pyruvyl transferase family protein [Rubrivivax sp.]|nr:MAG: polysaccharide pyruvyl transferase family protein [Rubrivivax sp.]